MILNCFGLWLKVLNNYFWEYITGVYISENKKYKITTKIKVFQDCKIT